MESAELVEYGTYDKIGVPAVPGDGKVSDDVLRAGEAESVLAYMTQLNLLYRNTARWRKQERPNQPEKSRSPLK